MNATKVFSNNFYSKAKIGAIFGYIVSTCSHKFYIIFSFGWNFDVQILKILKIYRKLRIKQTSVSNFIKIRALVAEKFVKQY